MPRVSPEHLERRRRQILTAAQHCFARKGFHETSMQDVFRESGLSAGAVYRYFRSKNDLVEAIATETFGRAATAMEDALAEHPVPGPAEFIGRMATTVESISGEDGPARVALMVWSAALHDPALHRIAQDVLTRFRTLCTTAAHRMRDDGRLPPDADPQAVGSALFALLPGFLVQRLILGDIDATDIERGVRALLRTP